MGALSILGIIFLGIVAIWLPRTILAIVGGLCVGMYPLLIVILAIIGFIVDILWLQE